MDDDRFEASQIRSHAKDREFTQHKVYAGDQLVGVNAKTVTFSSS